MILLLRQEDSQLRCTSVKGLEVRTRAEIINSKDGVWINGKLKISKTVTVYRKISRRVNPGSGSSVSSSHRVPSQACSSVETLE